MVASLHCSWPTHCLNHLYRLSVNYRAKACPDIQQNCKDICERFLVGGFLMRLMIFPIVTCTWWLDEVRCQNSQHEGSWQGVFMVNNESAVQTWKKKCACKFADWFSSVTLSIAADALPSIRQSSGLWVLASEQIRKSWNSQKKKKNYTHVVYLFRSRHFGEN